MSFKSPPISSAQSFNTRSRYSKYQFSFIRTLYIIVWIPVGASNQIHSTSPPSYFPFFFLPSQSGFEQFFFHFDFILSCSQNLFQPYHFLVTCFAFLKSLSSSLTVSCQSFYIEPIEAISSSATILNIHSLLLLVPTLLTMAIGRGGYNSPAGPIPQEKRGLYNKQGRGGYNRIVTAQGRGGYNRQGRGGYN